MALSIAQRAAQHDAMARGLARMAGNPDIHGGYLSTYVRGETGIPESVRDGILDLRDFVHGLSQKQISKLTGVCAATVHNVIKQDDADMDADVVDPIDNIAACAAELAALKTAHPWRQYEEHTGAEMQGLPMRRREIYVPLP